MSFGGKDDISRASHDSSFYELMGLNVTPSSLWRSRSLPAFVGLGLKVKCFNDIDNVIEAM